MPRQDSHISAGANFVLSESHAAALRKDIRRIDKLTSQYEANKRGSEARLVALLLVIEETRSDEIHTIRQIKTDDVRLKARAYREAIQSYIDEYELPHKLLRIVGRIFGVVLLILGLFLFLAAVAMIIPPAAPVASKFWQWVGKVAKISDPMPCFGAIGATIAPVGIAIINWT